jgi:hypothetical protein
MSNGRRGEVVGMFSLSRLSHDYPSNRRPAACSSVRLALHLLFTILSFFRRFYLLISLIFLISYFAGECQEGSANYNTEHTSRFSVRVWGPKCSTPPSPRTPPFSRTYPSKTTINLEVYSTPQEHRFSRFQKTENVISKYHYPRGVCGPRNGDTMGLNQGSQ